MNAIGYLSQKRINVELLLYTDSNSTLYIGVRLRPWKQESRNPEMILAQGLDVPDALNNAARALHKEEWRRLDFAARPWNNIVFDTETGSEAEQLDFLSIQPLSKTPLDIREAQRAIKKNSAPPEPS